MKKVLISKEKLLTKLKGNRDSHKKDYDEAVSGWEEKVIDGLRGLLEKAEMGESYETYLSLPEPTGHTQDYDDIISQIEWTEEKTIELDLNDFKKFVLDKWDWKADFAGTNAFYSKLK